MILNWDEFTNESIAYAQLPKVGRENVKTNYKDIKGAIDKAIDYLTVDKKLGGEQFLLEIAMAESGLGTHPDTVRMGHGDRGPFQLNKVGFNETKNVKAHPGLKKYHKALKERGIDWSKVTVDDCNKLIYGAIAARLLLLVIPEKLPNTLEGRAKYWKKYYNSSLGKGTPELYVDRVKKWTSMIQPRIYEPVHNLRRDYYA